MKLTKLVRCLLLYISDQDYRFRVNIGLGKYDRMDDSTFLSQLYYSYFHTPLNLDNPCGFNEKMQWLKIHNRNPLFTMLVDKYKVRDFVKEAIGEEYLIPLVGVWDSPEDIDFSVLPNQFVLKCNHNSGVGMFICKDKTRINKSTVIKDLEKGMRQNYYLVHREWPYKDVPRKIVAEKYICDSRSDLFDYKVFVFSGKAYCIQVDYDRFTNHKRNIYDTNWNYMPFTTRYPTDPGVKIEKPKCLGEMILLAEKLSEYAGTPPFIRVDMYVVNDRPLFGELTLFHGSGLEEFIPKEWDITLGNMIEI